MMADEQSLLVLEPFYGGSHKQLIDVIMETFHDENFTKFDLFTLPAKKWHWKARCSALELSEMIPLNVKYGSLFCSSVLNLCELLGLRPDLYECNKIIYFHENQLVYPVQKSDSCDFQYGYNQILSALTADEVLFNSGYNMKSFLDNIDRFLNTIPDYKPKAIKTKIKDKSKVLYFPVNFPRIPFCDTVSSNASDKVLHIVWAHRWEHDKDPCTFFDILSELQKGGFNFRVSVLGERFSEIPNVFLESKTKLGPLISHWGYVQSKSEYYGILQMADVAVSTAVHEFFGVSMMECAYCQCYPLCPNRLSYTELYPNECLYNTSRQLFKRLREYCNKPWLPAEHCKRLSIDFEAYSWKKRKYDLFKVLNIEVPKVI